MERNEAIGIVRNHLPHGSFKMLREALETLIPELKESENEEELKESLMQYLWDIYHKDCYPPKPSIELCNKWIAWLEKQGKKLPAGFYYVDSEGKGFYSTTCRCGDATLHVEKPEQKPVISDDALREGIAHFGITQDQIDDWLKKYIDAGKQYEQKDPCKDCPYPKLNCSNFPCIEKKAFDLGKSVFECVKTVYEKTKQEPAWSDADEERFLSCLKILGTGDKEQPDTANTFWLKTIKTRIQTIAKTVGEEQYMKGVRDSVEDVLKNPEDYGLLPTPS